MSQSPYMSTIEAARYLRCSASTLAKLRVYGGGPPFCKVGGKSVRYRQADLDTYMAANRVNSTAQLPMLAVPPAEASPITNRKNGRR